MIPRKRLSSGLPSWNARVLTARDCATEDWGIR